MNTIIGHQRTISSLQSAVKSNRLGHAYLFAGGEGVGKKRVALLFAQMITCAASDGQREVCHTCVSCRKIESGNHPDVKVITVDEEAKRIKIKQIIQLQADSMLRPLEATKKIFCIDDAHLLTPEAANSLLKTLEEPAENSLFILITAQPAVLLPTIVSRCQRIDFFPLLEKELTDHMKIEKNVPVETALFLSRFSGGSLGKAYAFLEQGVGEEKKSVEMFLDSLGTMTAQELFTAITQTIQNKERVQLSLDLFLYLLQERYLVAIKNGTGAGQNSLEGAVRLLLRLRQTAYKNINLKLALEQIFLEMKYAHYSSSCL